MPESDPHEWPRLPADADLAAELATLLLGVRLPLGGDLRPVDNSSGPVPAAGSAAAQPEPAGPLVVEYHVSAASFSPGTAAGVTFVDDEQTPIAALEFDQPPGPAPAPARVILRGRLSELAAPTEQAAHALMRPPSHYRAGLADADLLAVLRDRPLSAAAHRQLAEAIARHGVRVLLIAAVGGSAGRLPDEVLLNSLRASADELGNTDVVAVALSAASSELPGVAALLAEQYGARYVLPGVPVTGTSVVAIEVSPELEPTWPALLSALDAPGELPTEHGSAATRQLLRDWRPPRASRGLTLFFTGLSGSGKSTIAADLSARLSAHYHRPVSLLDGDRVRRLLSSGLGFSRPDRETNVRRIGWVAAEISRHGGIAVCAPIAPYAATRSWVRKEVSRVGDFVLIHVATSLEVCEARDRKGLYAAARAGRVAEFTGISDPYEVPEDAELVLDTAGRSVPECTEHVLSMLVAGGWIDAAADRNIPTR